MGLFPMPSANGPAILAASRAAHSTASSQERVLSVRVLSCETAGAGVPRRAPELLGSGARRDSTAPGLRQGE